MTQVNELKPCPWCGGVVTYYYSGSSDHVIDCDNPKCHSHTNFWVRVEKEEDYGEGEVIEAKRRWNTRPIEAQKDAQIAALVEALGKARRFIVNPDNVVIGGCGITEGMSKQHDKDIEEFWEVLDDVNEILAAHEQKGG